MTDATQSLLSEELTDIWLRGLLSVAWADGELDPTEQDLIHSLTQQRFDDANPAENFASVPPKVLADAFGANTHAAENFLRMAVMVALADRSYSTSEDVLLNQYCQALGLKTEALDALRQTLSQVCAEAEAAETVTDFDLAKPTGLDPLNPVKEWLDQLEIHEPKVAHFLCRMIPPQCPFERDVNLFGRKVAHIPALCKLNPLYEQFVGLRFRALSYLADDCKEDISEYC
jgi:tellurite resistance protein